MPRSWSTQRVLAAAIAIVLVAITTASGYALTASPAPKSMTTRAKGSAAQSNPLARQFLMAQGDNKPKEECTTPLGCGDDLGWALDLESRILDNFWFGQIYEIDYATPERIPGNVASVHHFGDSALWTGTYLAAESYRYALAKQYLERDKKEKPKLSKSEREFWAAQKADAKARVEQMVAKYHILVNISENWDHEFEPSTRTGFGGGVFRGEKGYLMRACNPAGALPWQTWTDLDTADDPDPDGPEGQFTGNYRVFGPLAWRDGTKYFCEDGTSRDAYAGTTFGLLTAFDLVSEDDAAMRTTIRDDIITLVDFAVKYYWNTPRPHGRISIPINSNRKNSPCKEINTIFHSCGHDFENFISPLFVQVPMARLNMAKAANHVAHAAGHPDVAKWDAVYAEELATQVPVLAFSMEVDAFQPNEGYFKYNLHHLTGFNITRLEQDAGFRLAFKQAFGVMDRTTGDDVNAHFEAITFALTGQASRRDAGIQHLRGWREYRARTDLNPATNNSQFCGVPLDCVPQEQVAITQSPADEATVSIPPINCANWKSIAAQVNEPVRQVSRTIDGRERTAIDARCRAARPLPVALRPPTDFLWQRPPTQLDGNDSVTHQAPGIDYLLPYWMLRYYTEAAVPAVEPFPTWVGPAHS